eukprot:COSAG02_NODE_38311_length_430_cov_1.383686_1_plen_76_part_10
MCRPLASGTRIVARAREPPAPSARTRGTRPPPLAVSILGTAKLALSTMNSMLLMLLGAQQLQPHLVVYAPDSSGGG